MASNFIIEHQASMFDAGHSALVIPINTMGVMGAGVAKAAAVRYPWVLESQQQVIDSTGLSVGRLYNCEAPKKEPHQKMAAYDQDDPDLILFPTKKHWKDPSQYSYIFDGLRELNGALYWYMTAGTNENRTVGIPALGCGLGGLRWDFVLQIMDETLNDVPRERITIYAPK